MRDRVFLASEKHQKQHWRADRENSHPDIIGGHKPTRYDPDLKMMRVVACRGFEPVFRRRMAALGVPMWAHCIRRSDTEQTRLKAQGFSKAGPGESAHSLGAGVDFVHGTRAWDLTPLEWKLVGHVGHEVARSLGLKVRWGGDDRDWDPGDTFRWDPAHWELSEWKAVRATIRLHGQEMSVADALYQMALERSK